MFIQVAPLFIFTATRLDFYDASTCENDYYRPPTMLQEGMFSVVYVCQSIIMSVCLFTVSGTKWTSLNMSICCHMTPGFSWLPYSFGDIPLVLTNANMFKLVYLGKWVVGLRLKGFLGCVFLSHRLNSNKSCDHCPLTFCCWPHNLYELSKQMLNRIISLNN